MNLRTGPYGGGNQFGQSLTQFLYHQGIEVVHELVAHDIDVILVTETRRWLDICAFDMAEAVQYRSRHPRTAVVLRINECDERKDNRFKLLNRLLLASAKSADHVVYISQWLQDLFATQLAPIRERSSVIRNGGDTSLFNRQGFTPWSGVGTLKLVTHHWGGHWNKGFDVYTYLDRLIGGSLRGRFEFTYIGNLPAGVRLHNSTVLSPTSGPALAALLKRHHAYITASINEPAGMHHVEAALCNLPIIYRVSGALPEYCKTIGVPLHTPDDVLGALDLLRQRYSRLVQNATRYENTADHMAEQYVGLFSRIQPRTKSRLIWPLRFKATALYLKDWASLR